MFFFKMSNFTEAVTWVEQALMMEPSRAIAHYNLAEIYIAAREREKAIRELELFISLAPKTATAKYAQEQLKALKK